MEIKITLCLFFLSFSNLVSAVGPIKARVETVEFSELVQRGNDLDELLKFVNWSLLDPSNFADPRPASQLKKLVRSLIGGDREGVKRKALQRVDAILREAVHHPYGPYAKDLSISEFYRLKEIEKILKQEVRALGKRVKRKEAFTKLFTMFDNGFTQLGFGGSKSKQAKLRLSIAKEVFNRSMFRGLVMDFMDHSPSEMWVKLPKSDFFGKFLAFYSVGKFSWAREHFKEMLEAEFIDGDLLEEIESFQDQISDDGKNVHMHRSFLIRPAGYSIEGEEGRSRLRNLEFAGVSNREAHLYRNLTERLLPFTIMDSSQPLTTRIKQLSLDVLERLEQINEKPTTISDDSIFTLCKDFRKTHLTGIKVHSLTAENIQKVEEYINLIKKHFDAGADSADKAKFGANHSQQVFPTLILQSLIMAASKELLVFGQEATVESFIGSFYLRFALEEDLLPRANLRRAIERTLAKGYQLRYYYRPLAEGSSFEKLLFYYPKSNATREVSRAEYKHIQIELESFVREFLGSTDSGSQADDSPVFLPDLLNAALEAGIPSNAKNLVDVLKNMPEVEKRRDVKIGLSRNSSKAIRYFLK